MKKHLATTLAACCLLAAFFMPASALEYHFDSPNAGTFGTPTSEETILVGVSETANTNRSKNAAYIPPTFGSPSSYTIGTWDRLTPNLTSGTTNGTVSGTGGAMVTPPPFVENGTNSTLSVGYTSVTDDLYYSGGHLGTLKIPSIGLTVKVYEGTDSAALRNGAGHFIGTSIWDGNVCIAGHNRGVNNHFGQIHTLNVGDTVELTTKLGTRSYEVYSVVQVSVNDVSILNVRAENIITLVTCVMDQPEYRWCVQARQKAT